jgi:hypothetical protein
MLPIRRSVPRPLRLLSGHLGSTVSALVDGQLDDEAAERAWQHVLHCPPCRRLVEHEGWVKRQLAQIADAPRADEPSDRFLGSLLDLDPAAVAWAETQEIEDRGRTRRRAGIALVGAGSVSAAVLGLSTLSGAPLGLGGGTGTPAGSIGRASATSAPTPAVVAPPRAVRGRLRGWTLEPARGGVTHAHAIDDHR